MTDYQYALEMYGQAMKDYYKADARPGCEREKQLAYENMCGWQAELVTLAKDEARRKP